MKRELTLHGALYSTVILMVTRWAGMRGNHRIVCLVDPDGHTMIAWTNTV